jgi:hypothetical protein
MRTASASGGVHDDRLAILVAAAEDDRVREVLDRVDRLAVAADQHAEVVAVADREDLLVRLLDLDRAAHADLVGDPLDHLA